MTIWPTIACIATFVAVGFPTVDSAFNYWIAKGNLKMNINRYADREIQNGQLAEVTRAVNGGTTHIDSRGAYLDYLRQFLGDEKYPMKMHGKLQREEV